MLLVVVLLATTLAGCAGTHYGPTDPDVRGMRYFGRRQFERNLTGIKKGAIAA